MKALLDQMADDGLQLSLATEIRIAGTRNSISRWLPVLETRKPEIIGALLAQEFTEAYEERAAIMEFDGDMSRAEAESAAYYNTPRRNPPNQHEEK